MTDVAERLRTADIEVVGRFANASNATLLVRLLDRDPTPAPDGAGLEDLDHDDLAVYKPKRGERPLWDFPDGTLHRREVAASRLSDLLGWDLVPTTVLREDAPFGVGSIQRFVTHDPEQHYFVLEQRLTDDGSPLRRQLEQMVLLDAVMVNADRKGGHVMVEHVDGRECLRLVDHGVTFHVDDKLRTVAWDYAEEEVAVDDRATLASLTTGTALVDALGDLLSPNELVATATRLAHVATWRTFPHPDSDHRYPWPLL